MAREPLHPDPPGPHGALDRPVSPEPLDGDEPTLPADLVGRLRDLDARAVEVPASLERSILLQSRARLAQAAVVSGTARGRSAWRFIVPAAAAAAVALLVWWVQPEARQVGGFPVQQTAGDFNGDGRVDIIDAFELARWQQEGVRPPLADVNGDEQFTAADVDAIAARAVALDREGVSS